MLYMATGKLAHCKLTIASVIIIFMNTIINYILSAKTTVFLYFRQRLSSLSTVVMISCHKSMWFLGNLSLLLTNLQPTVSVLQIYFLVTGHSGIGAKIPMKPHRLMI